MWASRLRGCSLSGVCVGDGGRGPRERPREDRDKDRRCGFATSAEKIRTLGVWVYDLGGRSILGVLVSLYVKREG